MATLGLGCIIYIFFTEAADLTGGPSGLTGVPYLSIAETLARRIRVEYNQSPIVTVVPPGTIPRGPGKAKRTFSPGEYRGLVERFTEH